MNINTINSGHYYGTQAIQNGLQKLNTVSEDVASNNENNNSIEENAVKLLEAKQEVEVGAKVVTAQDKTIGSLLDILT